MTERGKGHESARKLFEIIAAHILYIFEQNMTASISALSKFTI